MQKLKQKTLPKNSSSPKSHPQKFLLEGRHKLNGTIAVSGSKNAALPILCAALLTNEPSTIHNVPDIADIHTLLKIFEELNVKTTFQDHTVSIDPSQLQLDEIADEYVCSMRASILLLGPLVSRFKKINMPFPGGCVLGKRPASAHTEILKAFGANILEENERLEIAADELKPTLIRMPEQSVTATENALMIASLLPGKTEIKLAATEPHVQDLCLFLKAMGAKIEGIGTAHLVIEGSGVASPSTSSSHSFASPLHGTTYTITGDYLEAGTFAIAALLTQGEVTIEAIQTNQLDSFWQKLEEIGAKFQLAAEKVTLLPSPHLKALSILRTAVHPGFATDLQAPFAVLLTQAEGQSKVFETLFDGRLNYLYELEKMGAKVQILNPHQALIEGPTPLKGVPIASWDIRAGAAMVLAALCAEGKTEISNINYIDRGYEKLEQKLRSLGASIERI